MPVYFHWEQKVFSFSPIFDTLSFIQIFVSQVTKQTHNPFINPKLKYIQNQHLKLNKSAKLNLHTLNEKIQKLERHLRSQNDGDLPAMPLTIHEQLKQFL